MKMDTQFVRLVQLAEVYKVEHDWLFERLISKLNANKTLILLADRSFALMEYVSELGFQLTEKNPDIQICYMDLKPVKSPSSFLNQFVASLSSRFPEATSKFEIDSDSIDSLKVPTIIARRQRIRVAVFIKNCQNLYRFKGRSSFLRTLRVSLKNQKNCIFCLYGYNNANIREMIVYPGPLNGVGQMFQLKNNQTNHRSVSVRKLFHDHEKQIGYSTSVRMSYLVNNQPYYLKLLAWHALIRTQHTCTKEIVEDAMNDLIQHYDYHFRKVEESLTKKQLSFLIALLEGNQKLYSSAIRDKYQLGSTSNVARIKSSLIKKGILDSGIFDGLFIDPLFREWFRRRCSMNW
jgi:hypothetical protein